MRTLLFVLIAALFLSSCTTMKYVRPQEHHEGETTTAQTEPELLLNYFGPAWSAGRLFEDTVTPDKTLGLAEEAMNRGMSPSVHIGSHGTNFSAGYGQMSSGYAFPVPGGGAYAAPDFIFVPGQGYAPTGATRILPRLGTPVVTSVTPQAPASSQPVGKCPDSGVVRTVQEQAACSEDMIEVIMDNLPKLPK